MYFFWSCEPTLFGPLCLARSHRRAEGQGAGLLHREGQPLFPRGVRPGHEGIHPSSLGRATEQERYAPPQVSHPRRPAFLGSLITSCHSGSLPVSLAHFLSLIISCLSRSLPVSDHFLSLWVTSCLSDHFLSLWSLPVSLITSCLSDHSLFLWVTSCLSDHFLSLWSLPVSPVHVLFLRSGRPVQRACEAFPDRVFAEGGAA